MPGLVTVTQSGGCGCWIGFGSTLRSGIWKARPCQRVCPGAKSCGSARTYSSQALLGVVGVRAEAAELGPGGGAGRPELQPSVREDVERGGPLRDPDRVVHLGHAHHGAVADADALGLHRDRGEHQLGRGAVRVLLQEVVLDGPHPVEAELVGESGLREGVIEDTLLDAVGEGPRHRHLEEDPELHAARA